MNERFASSSIVRESNILNKLNIPCFIEMKRLMNMYPTLKGRIIVDTKTVESFTDEHRGRILNYLKISKLKVGLIINFKHPKLEWERLVLDTAR